MTFDFNCTGSDRKKLVNTIAALAEEDARYLGAPTFAYRIGPFHIDRNGTMTVADGTQPGDVDSLLERLRAEGFTAENTEPAERENGEETREPDGTSIQMPMAGFTDASLQNLFDLVEAKGNLIRKALGIDDLPIHQMGDRLDFPWFPAGYTPDELRAYMDFITALCEMAKNQKRITAREKPVDNEKYAFRCFLLRLGFIGSEHKQTRKILLRNLTGSSAFKSGSGKEVADDAVSE